MPGFIDVEHLTDQEKAEIEAVQKRKEVKLERWMVSKACTDLMEWIQAREPDDTMIKGINEETNPFKAEKGGCVIC